MRRKEDANLVSINCLLCYLNDEIVIVTAETPSHTQKNFQFFALSLKSLVSPMHRCISISLRGNVTNNSD